MGNASASEIATHSSVPGTPAMKKCREVYPIRLGLRLRVPAWVSQSSARIRYTVGLFPGLLWKCQ
jgi:hypothetical protein